jgi:Uma2 family endonuclease
VRLDEYWELRPDLAVIRNRDYGESLPEPEDVLLLIEVSDTTLSYDRNVKLPCYARSGIPEVFIVDLPGEAIERHTEPTGDGYRLTARTRRGERLESVVLPALALPVDAMLN